MPQTSTDKSYPSFTTTTEVYAHELYRDVVQDKEIECFLKEAELYNTLQAQWSTPAAPATSESLLDSVYDILSLIVRRFIKPLGPDVTRDVVNTVGIPEYNLDDEDGYRTSPGLIVRAAGPSFETPFPTLGCPSSVSPTDVGYSNMATYFGVMPKGCLEDVAEDLEEMENYAHEIFDAQLNRIYVRCLLVTETHVRLVHFDRAGVEITPPIDIHRNPATFIRLVVGTCSMDERLLGFDDTIQWRIADGRKEKATLAMRGCSGATKTFSVLEQIHKPQDFICSRATACWRVQDPDTGEELVVKDSWAPDNRPAEHELLGLVKGLPGLAQLISFDIRRLETKEFRCPSTAGQYENRVASRIAMKSYGKPLEFFTSTHQVLSAIRDAIAGHQILGSDGIDILHRDISHNNILLGGEGAPEGYRGILIDLDLAFKATDADPRAKADHNIGTRLFQSISVLTSSHVREGEIHPSHDYLDDLESFLYTLVYIFLVHMPDGRRLPDDEEGPSIVWEWDDHRPGTSSRKKRNIYMSSTSGFRALRIIKNSWGSACATLFEEFRLWVLEKRDEKEETLMGTTARTDCNPLAAFLRHRNEHYSAVLAMFDKALQGVKPLSPPLPASDVLLGNAKLDKPTNVSTLGTNPNLSAPQPAACNGSVLGPEARLSNDSVSEIQCSVFPCPSPSEPSRKRRSEDGEHPDVCNAKARRINTTTVPSA